MKELIAVTAVLLVVFSACSPKAIIKSIKENKVTSPRGFEIELPPGYETKTDDNGVVTASNPENDSNILFFKLAYANDKIDTDEIASSVVKSVNSINPDTELGQGRKTKYGIAYKLTANKSKGVMLVAENGKNICASGVLYDSKKTRSELIKAASTFKFRPDLIDPKKLKGLIRMKKWTDPKEKAFAVMVPEGFDIEGGLERPYIDAAIRLSLKKGKAGIYLANPQVPIYTEPSSMMEFAGFTEGSEYNPGGSPTSMIVQRWHNAEDYIMGIYGPDMMQAHNIQAENRSDVASKIPQMPLVNQNTAAEGSFDKDGVRHNVVALTQEVGMDGNYIWTASVLHYWAPAAEMKKMEKIVSKMQASFTVSQSWAAEESRQIQKRSQILSTTANEISEMMSSSFELKSKTMDQSMDKYSNAILGVTDVYDENTGETYEVPNDSNHYWKNGYELYGTDTADPPYHDPNFKELTQTD